MLNGSKFTISNRKNPVKHDETELDLHRGTDVCLLLKDENILKI